MRDRNFAFGVGFHDQIRRFVEYAHVFMPVITRPSCFEQTTDIAATQAAEQCQRPGASGWVHQEIGYYQTIFTRHAPSLQARIEDFDGEFDYLLAKSNWSAGNSRQNAIREIKELISKC